MCELRPEAAVVHMAHYCAGDAHSAALTSNGFLFMWGSNEKGQLGLPAAAEVAAQASVRALCALSVYCHPPCADRNLLSCRHAERAACGLLHVLSACCKQATMLFYFETRQMAGWELLFVKRSLDSLLVLCGIVSALTDYPQEYASPGMYDAYKVVTACPTA